MPPPWPYTGSFMRRRRSGLRRRRRRRRRHTRDCQIRAPTVPAFRLVDGRGYVFRIRTHTHTHLTNVHTYNVHYTITIAQRARTRLLQAASEVVGFSGRTVRSSESVLALYCSTRLRTRIAAAVVNYYYTP